MDSSPTPATHQRRPAHRWLAAVIGVIAMAACEASGVPPGSTVTATRDRQGGTVTVQRGGELDAQRPAHATWEEAAVAEAMRLSPALVAPVAERVRFGAPVSFERVQVTAPGYCHVFGGLHDDHHGWQANDLGPC